MVEFQRLLSSTRGTILAIEGLMLNALMTRRDQLESFLEEKPAADEAEFDVKYLHTAGIEKCSHSIWLAG